MSEKNKTLYVMPHSHIDVEWYWSLNTTLEWTSDILRKAMTLLRQDPEYRFTQDQVVLLRSFWEELDESEQAFFRRMVDEGRLAIVGGTYIQPEVAEPNGESLIRQIIAGQEWLGATFGIQARCGWFIDTFGQIPQIPQILCRAGYHHNVFWRDIPLEIDFAAMPADFYWESPDGSRILTHWMPGGYSNSRKQMQMALDHSRTRHVLLPLGGDVTRPTQDSLAICQEVRSHLDELGVGEAEIRVASALEYIAAVAAETDGFPVLSYDFNPPYRAQDLRGTYDNRIELKKRHRAAEQALFNAEVVAATASISGHSYPSEVLAELWEKLLFTQFHDVIAGSHFDPVYLSAMDRLGSLLERVRPVTAESLRKIVPGSHKAGEWVAVFNTLAYPRSEVCQAVVSKSALAAAKKWALRDTDGRTSPVRIIKPEAMPGGQESTAIEFIASEVPPTGYKSYRLIPDTQSDVSYPNRVIGAHCIENGYFRVEWNPTTGDLTSIRDKVRQREILKDAGNVVVAAREKNPDMEGNIYLTGEEARSGDYYAHSIEINQDAVALTVRMRSQFQDCELVREVTLYDFTPRLDFVTALEDFTGGDVLIKASFPLKIDWERAERYYETPFAATPRPEGHFAAQTWVDCSDGDYGVALLNRGTPGYWIANGRLELVLLRSLANYTSYRKNGMALGVPGYQNTTQTELGREHGSHRFTYSLYPHAGTWRDGDLSRLGQSLNTPFVVLAGLGAPGAAGESFISFEPDFVMTALKLAQNGAGLIVRGYETRGQAHTVTMRVSSWTRQVHRANLLEEPGEPLPVMDGEVVFSCAPHEIVTLLLVS